MESQKSDWQPSIGDRVIISVGDARYKGTVVKYKSDGQLHHGCLVDGWESNGTMWYGAKELASLTDPTWRVVHLRCEAGHTQDVELPAAEYSEIAAHDFAVLIAGGTLKSLGREMPGNPCSHGVEGQPLCGKKITFTLSEKP